MPVATRPSLRPHRDDILRDCATGASGAAGESPLSGELPRLLDELSEWLEGDEPPAALAARSAAWPCATDRIDDPTRLARAIRELASLRAAILRHAGTAPRAAEDGGAAATSRADVRRLDAGLDGLVADAFERWGARRARALEAVRREQEDSRAAATPYGELVRISPDAVFVNRGGRIEFVNPAAVELFGAKSPEQLVGRSPFELFHPDYHPMIRERIAQLLGGKSHVARVEQRIVRLDGSQRDVEVAAAAFVDNLGQAIQVLLRDITDRKAAEERLARSEEVLAQAGTMAHLGAWWIEVSNPDDLNANPLRWSDETYRIFGYEPGSVVVTNALFFDHVHPDDRRGVVDAMAQALASRRPYAVQHRVVQRGGAERVVVEHAHARFDARGQPVLIVGAVQDVTEQRRAEQAVRESDQRKTEFLAVLSHELRNPLAPIRNSIYLLERAPAGSPQAMRARDVIERQTQHLTRLVDDLLDMTRISRGKIKIHTARLDVREVVRRTCDDHHSLLDGHGIELRVDLPAGPVWVEADPTRLSQIVANLLQNSAKFTPSGGRVTASVVSSDGLAAIAVHDTGVGIDPAHLERVFEPFAQAEQSLARTRGGLGLGLALVKGLVDQHGGTVRATSPGRGLGAEVVVTLPLARRGETPERARPPPPGRALDVLIIEDNADAGRSLADVLELQGHRVRVARDGRTGLELARETRPDVVLCDIGLPDLDGYELARAMRRDDAFRSTRIIALTGYAQPEDRQRAAEAGFDAHVSKPPALDALAEAMHAAS